jgi:cytosine/adenosine deaminase-related metal-dependent hydrolase
LSKNDALVKLSMCILGPDYSTLEVCRQDFRAAMEFGLPSSAHVWGRSNRLVPEGYRTLAAEGLLGAGHNVVHANYIEDDEIKVLIDHGASITSTTAGEMNNHIRPSLCGRVRRLGGDPSIGIDSEVGGKGDMFEVMRSTLRMQRFVANQETVRLAEESQSKDAAAFLRENLKTIGTGGSPIKEVAFKTREVLQWATINNAKAMGMDRIIGSLTPGKKADLIMLRRDALHIVSAQDPVQAVVSYAEPSDVDMVMVAGRIVKDNGKLLFEGLAKRIEELRASAARLLTEAGVTVSH